MFEKLMIAFCYFELFLLIASVIVLVVAAMLLQRLENQQSALNIVFCGQDHVFYST